MYTVLILGTVATWAMVGLIWLIQLVHYPLLASYSELLPGEAASAHARLITPIVGPLMAVEGITGLALMVFPPDGVSWAFTWLAGGLLAIALLSTILFSVPQHRALAEGHSAEAASKLIRTNWVRTTAWSARGVVLATALVVGA